MKNSEKYKSVQERTEAFADFCYGQKERSAHGGCGTQCPCWHDEGDCRFAWLELDEKEGKEVEQ